MRHRHMRDEAFAEEALFPREGPVDELVDQHEMTGGEVFLQRPDGRKRQDVGNAAAFHSVDIGAEIDATGRVNMAAPVPRQEEYPGIAEYTAKDGVRRRPPGAFHVDPLGILQPVDVIEATAADYAQHLVRHRPDLPP